MKETQWEFPEALKLLGFKDFLSYTSLALEIDISVTWSATEWYRKWPSLNDRHNIT